MRDPLDYALCCLRPVDETDGSHRSCELAWRQRREHFYRPGGTCRTILGENALGFSGDVSDEARRNISTIEVRVSEVGSRDSGEPRAQPHKR